MIELNVLLLPPRLQFCNGACRWVLQRPTFLRQLGRWGVPPAGTQGNPVRPGISLMHTYSHTFALQAGFLFTRSLDKKSLSVVILNAKGDQQAFSRSGPCSGCGPSSASQCLPSCPWLSLLPGVLWSNSVCPLPSSTCDGSLPSLGSCLFSRLLSRKDPPKARAGVLAQRSSVPGGPGHLPSQSPARLRRLRASSCPAGRGWS